MASITKGVRHDFHIMARRMFDRMGVQLYMTQRLENGDMNVFGIEKTERGSIMCGKRIPRSQIDGPVIIDSIDGFKPFLEVPEDIFRELLSAMQRLADEEGVPRPSEDHLKGKLEATQEHLKDVQNMLQFTTQLINRREKNGTDRVDQSDGDPHRRLLEQTQG